MHPHSVTGLSVRRCYHTQCLKLPNHVFLCLTLSIFGHVLQCLLLSRLISWNWQWGKFASWPLCKSICQSHFPFVAHLPCSPHSSCPTKINLWKVYQKYVCSRISCCKLFCSGRDSVQVLSVRFFQNSQITWEHIGSLWSCFLFLRFLVFLLRLNFLQKNPASLQLLFQVKYDSPSSGITRNTVASTFYLIFWSADIVTFIFEQLRLL